MTCAREIAVTGGRAVRAAAAPALATAPDARSNGAILALGREHRDHEHWKLPQESIPLIRNG